jgi:protein-tyrosine phosphatase
VRTTYDGYVQLTYVPNLRDVGGMATSSGRSVGFGRILRSGVPIANDRVPDGLVWPPSTVIDLRSAEEHQPTHPLSKFGAQIHSVPLLASLRPGAAMPNELADLYSLMLQNSSDHLVNIVDVVAHSDGPVLIHCSAGKDRTGISVALLLSLVGVGREDVTTDYLRSKEHFDEIEARFDLLLAGNRAKLPSAYFTVVPDAINRVFDAWQAHPEGVTGWYLESGGDESTLERLHGRLLEG